MRKRERKREGRNTEKEEGQTERERSIEETERKKTKRGDKREGRCFFFLFSFSAAVFF